MRIWAPRGLPYCWDDVAHPAMEPALDDEAWRVREMALKVVARHRLADSLATVAGLQEDLIPRVRGTSRALMRLATGGQ